MRGTVWAFRSKKPLINMNNIEIATAFFVIAKPTEQAVAISKKGFAIGT
jgi:hypothetical protein